MSTKQKGLHGFEVGVRSFQTCHTATHYGKYGNPCCCITEWLSLVTKSSNLSTSPLTPICGTHPPHPYSPYMWLYVKAAKRYYLSEDFPII